MPAQVSCQPPAPVNRRSNNGDGVGAYRTGFAGIEGKLKAYCLFQRFW